MADSCDVVPGLHGVLGDGGLDAFARAVHSGDAPAALSLLEARGGEGVAGARDLVRDLAPGLHQGRRGDRGAAWVREDLSVQPCLSDVARLAMLGHAHAAALLAVAHEGYDFGEALGAVRILAREHVGEPVALVPADPARLSGGRAVGRFGNRVTAGEVRTLGSCLVYDGGGEPVPATDLTQAWVAVPVAEARRSVEAVVEACLSGGMDGLARRISEALVP